MNQERDLIISTINKTITEVKEIMDGMKENKIQVDEIKALRTKLFELEKSLGPKRDWYNEKLNRLDTLLNELLEVKMKINLGSIGDMFISIGQNLIDEMKLEEVEKGKGDLLVGDKKVGSIEIKKDSNKDLIIKAEILGITDDFKVDDPVKMYSVISFINTKYNYYSTTNKK
jgi:predicted RNA-binding protein with EMAP domain